MNESWQQGLIEDFQDDTLTEAECRELMVWFDEDESRVSAFADELRMVNTLAALHAMESGRIPLAVNASLQRGDLPIDISRSVRQRIESRPQPSPGDVERSNLSLRRWDPRWIAMVAAVIALYVADGFRYRYCFDNAAVCAPTRSCWITGMYGISNGTQPMRRHRRRARLPSRFPRAC
jgi:hypothetical protein